MLDFPSNPRSVEKFYIDYVLVNRYSSHTHFGGLRLSHPSSRRAISFSSSIVVGITTTDSLPKAAIHHPLSKRNYNGFRCRQGDFSLPDSCMARRGGYQRGPQYPAFVNGYGSADYYGGVCRCGILGARRPPDDNLSGRFRCAMRDFPYCTGSHSRSPFREARGKWMFYR
jgi:hypothetical protein